MAKTLKMMTIFQNILKYDIKREALWSSGDF